MRLNLLREVSRNGIACDLVLSRAQGELTGSIPRGIRVINLNASRAIRALPGLVRYLRSVRPWAMISAEDHSNVVALMARKITGYPPRISVSTHVSPLLWAARPRPHQKKFWLKKGVHSLYPTATARLAPSTGMAQEMSESFKIPRDSISVIGNPVVTPELLESQASSPPHPWFTDGGPPVILAVGSLTRIKGFSFLIRAFAELRRHVPARLVILGKGPLEAELRGVSNELGLSRVVAFPGFKQNPYPFFANADLFVLSSIREGFGNVLVEAMALGCPVVSTDCPTGPAEILERGTHGPLVPMGDIQALAAAMEERLSSPRNAADLRKAAERFHVREILATYRDLLEF